MDVDVTQPFYQYASHVRLKLKTLFATKLNVEFPFRFFRCFVFDLRRSWIVVMPLSCVRVECRRSTIGRCCNHGYGYGRLCQNKSVNYVDESKNPKEYLSVFFSSLRFRLIEIAECSEWRVVTTKLVVRRVDKCDKLLINKYQRATRNY